MLLSSRSYIALTLCVLGLCASAAFSAQPGDAPINVTVDRSADMVPAAPDRTADSDLGTRLQEELRADPLFQTARISIDLYGGLAIVHGSAPNREMIVAINDKLRTLPQLDVIFNYMSSPDTSSMSAVLTYDSLDRQARTGTFNSSFAIAQRVQDRLSADPRLSGQEIDVDSYMGLVILHGAVNDPQSAKLARDIAAHTDGVADVMSFLDETSPALGAPVAVRVAPITVRTAVLPPLPDIEEPVPTSVIDVECD